MWRSACAPATSAGGMDAVDLVIFDEAYELTEAEVAALAGAQLSAPNAQTIYASTPAVWEKHSNCNVLSDMRPARPAAPARLVFC